MHFTTATPAWQPTFEKQTSSYTSGGGSRATVAHMSMQVLRRQTRTRTALCSALGLALVVLGNGLAYRFRWLVGRQPPVRTVEHAEGPPVKQSHDSIGHADTMPTPLQHWRRCMHTRPRTMASAIISSSSSPMPAPVSDNQHAVVLRAAIQT